MTQTPKPTLEEILPEARAFHRAFGSLLLATTDAAGQPHASYAAHLADAWGHFHIYISELAAHTGNLRARGRASVMFIEDEDKAGHLFARKRLTCDCRAEWVPRNTPPWHETMDRFVAEHGQFMEMLKGLEDFQLFRLVPEKAVYVRGFAQAYELSGEQLSEIRHINGQGHRSGSQAGAVEGED